MNFWYFIIPTRVIHKKKVKKKKKEKSGSNCCLDKEMEKKRTGTQGAAVSGAAAQCSTGVSGMPPRCTGSERSTLIDSTPWPRPPRFQASSLPPPFFESFLNFIDWNGIEKCPCFLIFFFFRNYQMEMYVYKSLALGVNAGPPSPFSPSCIFLYIWFIFRWFIELFIH